MNNSQNLEAGIVDVEDNSAETLLAFETQAKQFEQVQNDFEDYMDRLKEDIDARADEFGHIEYYDARLQDGHSNELAIAAGEVREMDDRRKSLTVVNPLLAKKSELPPVPQVEDLVYEHLSLNLPLIAKNALEELSNKSTAPEEIGFAPAPEPVIDNYPTADGAEEDNHNEDLNKELDIETGNGDGDEGGNETIDVVLDNTDNSEAKEEESEKDEAKEEEDNLEEDLDGDLNEDEEDDDLDEDDEEDDEEDDDDLDDDLDDEIEKVEDDNE